MASFTGYFDASGSEADSGVGPHESVLVAAGAVADVDRWATFDEQWLAYLGGHGVEHFHMKEFAHFKGPFKSGWNGAENVEKRKAFLQRLTALTQQTVETAFISTLVLSEYREFDKSFQLTEFFGGAYSLAQTHCVIQTVQWVIANHPKTDAVKFFVEHGDTGQDRFMWMMREQFHFTADHIMLMPKRSDTGEDFTPFHVPDFIGYEYHSDHGVRAATGKQREKPRGALTNIRETLEPHVAIIERKVLERMCEKIPPRR